MTATDSPPLSPTDRSQRPTLVRYGVLAWLCAAAAIAYASRTSISVAESTIRAELDLSKEQMGQIMGLFFLSYAFGQVPLSWLGGALGSRRCLTWFACLWSAATVAMSFAGAAPLLVVSRVANGLAQAGLFPCCTMTLADWFPANRRAVASGSLASSMSIGSAIGTSVGGLLIVVWGWRVMFGILAACGLAWAIGFYYWFRDTPEQHPRVNEAERDWIVRGRQRPKQGETDDEPTGRWRVWLALTTSPATWWICGQQFCRAAGQAFFVSWFATYLQETRGVSIAASGTLNMLPLLTLVVGSLFGGGLSDWILTRTGSRRLARQGVASSAMLACAGCVLIALWIDNPWLAVAVISIGSFCAASGGPCAYSITIDMGGRHVAALFALMNMIGNIGAYLFILTTPKLLVMVRGWGASDVASWNSILVLFCLLYLTAAICWGLLRSEGTVFEQSLLGRR